MDYVLLSPIAIIIVVASLIAGTLIGPLVSSTLLLGLMLSEEIILLAIEIIATALVEVTTTTITLIVITHCHYLSYVVVICFRSDVYILALH